MNTMMQNMGGRIAVPESEQFDNWLTKAVPDPDPQARNQALAAWHQAPAARDAHPREEPLLPLHVVAGAAGGDIGKKMFGGAVVGTVQSAVAQGIELPIAGAEFQHADADLQPFGRQDFAAKGRQHGGNHQAGAAEPLPHSKGSPAWANWR